VTVTLTHQVTPNAGVDFDAKVMTVVLYGKKVRFTGGRCAQAADMPAPNETWAGTAKQKGLGGWLRIVRQTDTGKFSGEIVVPTEHGPNWQIRIGEQTEGGPGGQRSTTTIVTENQYLHPTKKARITPEVASRIAAENRASEEAFSKIPGKLADAVPLITPGPALPANNAVEQFWKKGNPRFVKLHSIVLNNAAFGADAVSAVIDGKEYRFVGSMSATSAIGASWRGYEREANLACQSRGSITLQKYANGAIGGYVFLSPNRRLDISTPQSSPPSFGSSVQLIEALEP
jgi:hypothetical protein